MAWLDLLQDTHLDKVWDAVLPVGDASHCSTPFLPELGLFRLLGLFCLLLFPGLLRSFKHSLQVRELLFHHLVDCHTQLGFHYWKHLLPSQLHIVTLVKVVALVTTLPCLCVLVDLLHELLNDGTGTDFMRFFLRRFIFTFALFPILLAVLAAFLCILPLSFGILAWGKFLFVLWLVESSIKLVEVSGKLAQLVWPLSIVENPLAAFIQQVCFDVCPFGLVNHLQLLL
mmetsp:Transcript_66789/g.159805  ORF Transcript_66789/g.159805 Transcript_66789/m.159805 type:complete len:228 (+) Transcript_66789:1043-1726(+)